MRSNGAEMIAAERQRQVEVEGWTPEHDALHGDGQLVDAARCYLIAPRFKNGPPHYWPWHLRYWKPTPEDRVRELVKAGALIAAEIDRLSPVEAPAEPRCICGCFSVSPQCVIHGVKAGGPSVPDGDR